MAAPFPGQMNAFQVGSYFVNNYYHMLQNRPDMVHQFYNNLSTMVRLDVNSMDSSTATGMLQIHGVIMNLNLNGIEIKTAQFLDSWNGGILVMVSGFAQVKDWVKRKRFIQSFFLAPQEKGYFVLNDMIHFLDEEPEFLAQYPPAGDGTGFVQSGAHNVADQSGLDYGTGEQLETNEEAVPVPVQQEETGTGIGTGTVDQYIDQEEAVLTEPEPEIEEEPVPVQEPVPEPEPVVPAVPEPEPEPVAVPAVPVQEPVHVQEPVRAVAREVEPVVVPADQPKLSYAAALRAKAQQLGQSQTLNPAPQKKIVSEPKPVQTAPLLEKPVQEPFQDLSIGEDEGETFSVYVANLAPSMQVSDLEMEFKTFGPIKPDGIAIRSRKETGVVFAFIDFEDSTAVQNAVKASPLQVNGRSLHIEERKPGLSRAPRRGGGRGTRGGYPSEPSRRPFNAGRNYGERDFASRPRNDGYSRRNGHTS
ncbi:hypothetical protein LUZ60_016286 [Juncus effusus]|nr:hypothetical protein LUZ60_016286 [Juncus effusus]